MQESLRAIVLKVTPYTDNSSIVRLYSREYGLVSCIAGNLHKRGSSLRTSFLHPMSLLNIVVISKQKGMFRMQEATPVFPLYSVMSDPSKSAICMFLAEILNQTYTNAQPDEKQFAFLENAMQLLELSETCPPDFHVVFLWKLSLILGISPRNNYHETESPKFDLVNGCFVESAVYGQEIADAKVSALIFHVLNSDFSASATMGLTRKQRKELLDLTIRYFSFHLGWRNEIKSHIVLQEVFQD